MELFMDKDTIQIFFEDANEGLDLSIDEIIELEEGYNEKIVDEIMRTMHSIKGGSGMLKLQEIEHFSHKLEDVFVEMKSGTIKLNVELVDILISGINLLKKWILLREDNFHKDESNFMEDIEEENKEMENVILKLNKVIGVKEEKRKNESIEKKEIVIKKEEGAVNLELYLDETAPMFALKRVILEKKLSENGKIIEMYPNKENILDESINYFKLLYKSEIVMEDLIKMLDISDVNLICIEEVETEKLDVYIRNDIKKDTVHIMYDLFCDIIEYGEIGKIIKGENNFDIYGIQILEALKKDRNAEIVE